MTHGVQIVSALARRCSSAMAGLLVSAGPAHADDPVMHHVTYTVSAQNPIYANIYYMDQEPAISPTTATTPTGSPPTSKPISPRVSRGSSTDVAAKPEDWAMVTSTPAANRARRSFIATCGRRGVVVSKDGPKGVLCSLRNW